MVGAMTQTVEPYTEESPWSAREAELLAVTLRLLQEHGYDQLTVDAVAAAGRASKATVYRRWPSKAELVLAAFTEGVRQVAVAPNTGSLRGDLICLGEICGEHGRLHASTIRAVLVEVSRHPALNDVLQEQFLKQRKALIRHVLRQAVDRGEIHRRRRRRRALGSAARVPDLPVDHPGPAAHSSHRAAARRPDSAPGPDPNHPVKASAGRAARCVRVRLLYSTVQYRTLRPSVPPERDTGRGH